MEQDATAIANQLVDANLFDITGPIRVNYSASSFQGGPQVSYKDADLDLNFQDDEITRIQTPQGELVTVTLDNQVDAFTRTFTLVVPSIRLPRGQEVEFTTLGFETTDRSGAFLPTPGPSGVLQTYQVYQLRAPPSTSSSFRETGQVTGAEPSFLRQQPLPRHRGG